MSEDISCLHETTRDHEARIKKLENLIPELLARIEELEKPTRDEHERDVS